MATDPFELRITVNEPWHLDITVDNRGTTYSGQVELTEDVESTEWTDWGTTFPDATTTGLRTDNTPVLKDFNDPDTTGDVIIADGDEVADKTIWGRVKFAGEGRIARCILKGPKNMPSGQTGVIDVTGKRGGLAWIEDCLCDPQTPNHRMDFLVGKQFRAYRNRIRGVVDGFGTFTKEEWSWDSQITENGWIVDSEHAGNWVESVIYFFPDDNHSDGPHTDGRQHQGGLGSEDRGNRYSGYAVKLPGSGDNPDKPWLLTPPNHWANGAGVIIQDNVGGGLDETVISELNWFEGWIAHANLKNGGPYIFRENRHSTDVAAGPSAGMSGSKLNPNWIRIQSRSQTKVTGLNTNIWWNGPQEGDILTEPRDQGITVDSA